MYSFISHTTGQIQSKRNTLQKWIMLIDANIFNLLYTIASFQKVDDHKLDTKLSLELPEMKQK